MIDFQPYVRRSAARGSLLALGAALWLSFGSGAVLPAAEINESAEAHLHRGLLFGQAGDEKRASVEFREALRLRPDFPEAHYNLGLTEIADIYGKTDWQAAMAEFRVAIELRPDYAEAHHALGAALLETGALAAAVVEFRAAVNLNAHSPQNHLDLGKALAQTGDAQAAIAEYREAVRLRPGYSDAEAAWGKLLAGGDNPAESLEHFRQAVRTNPDNGAAEYGFAQGLKRQGQTEQAAVAFREARDLATRLERRIRALHLSNEGLDTARHGDRNGAVSILRNAVALQPDLALPHYNLALLLADSGDVAGGLAQVVQAISLAPSDSRYYLSLGRMWMQQGSESKARAAFERACQLDPENSAARNELGQVSNRGTAAQTDPYEYGAPADTADDHFAFATVLARRSDWIGSAGEWLRVLALRPDDVNARNNLAVAYSHAGKYDEAELEFWKALQVSPDSADAHFGLAVIALERHDNSTAIQELQQVIRIRPAYPQAEALLSRASGRSQ